ncbi:hypothetical protein UM396_14580 [Geobacillus subterraneus]|uniref:hypothetical protein n=1 Tax=Geobacillus subterraneus TaxID=129338 RepID=UPI002AC9D81B|nr:hypothetical protein [Geobacillus subterraneus]WPZ17808.1 hypothetical protein UM396_14580 [Geobacillus subterraneus]
MIPYDERVRVLRREAAKAHDYICLEEFYKAKLAILNGDWAEENILEVLMRGNYTGAVARIAYYRFVHRLGFDVRALWDAIILEWMFYFVWQPEFDQAIKTQKFKKALRRFQYPQWVEFGLIGGGLDKLKKMGEEFSLYMESRERR